MNGVKRHPAESGSWRGLACFGDIGEYRHLAPGDEITAELTEAANRAKNGSDTNLGSKS